MSKNNPEEVSLLFKNIFEDLEGIARQINNINRIALDLEKKINYSSDYVGEVLSKQTKQAAPVICELAFKLTKKVEYLALSGSELVEDPGALADISDKILYSLFVLDGMSKANRLSVMVNCIYVLDKKLTDEAALFGLNINKENYKALSSLYEIEGGREPRQIMDD